MRAVINVLKVILFLAFPFGIDYAFVYLSGMQPPPMYLREAVYFGVGVIGTACFCLLKSNWIADLLIAVGNIALLASVILYDYYPTVGFKAVQSREGYYYLAAATGVFLTAAVIKLIQSAYKRKTWKPTIRMGYQWNIK